MKIAGTVLMLFALIIAVVPRFTDCQSQGRAIELENGRTIPMKCHWTAQAETAVAGPLLVLGGFVSFNKRKENLRLLAVLGAVLGLFAILLPTALIGVCMSDEMLCNIAMKPTLIFSGLLTIGVSAVVFVKSTAEAKSTLPKPSAELPL